MGDNYEVYDLREGHAVPKQHDECPQCAALRAKVEELRADRDRWQGAYNTLEDRRRDEVAVAESRAPCAEAELATTKRMLEEARKVNPCCMYCDMLEQRDEARAELEALRCKTCRWSVNGKYAENPVCLTCKSKALDNWKDALADCEEGK